MNKIIKGFCETLLVLPLRRKLMYFSLLVINPTPSRMYIYKIMYSLVSRTPTSCDKKKCPTVLGPHIGETPVILSCKHIYRRCQSEFYTHLIQQAHWRSDPLTRTEQNRTEMASNKTILISLGAVLFLLSCLSTPTHGLFPGVSYGKRNGVRFFFT